MDSVIEPFSTPRWNKRITGYFKYKEKTQGDVGTEATLVGIPHPLRTERYTMPIPVGTTLDKVVDSIHKTFHVDESYEAKLTVMLNGVPVSQDKWKDTVIKPNDSVAYRCVPGKGAIRTLAVLALAVVAPYVASWALGVSGVVTTAAVYGVYYGTYAAVMLAGTALISKISPVRPPAEPTQPGSSERQLMVSGGSNQANPYGAKPVILQETS
jgi:hypothetical protein